MDVDLYHDTLTFFIEASEQGCRENLWPPLFWMSLDVGFEFRSEICTVCFCQRRDQFVPRGFCELAVVLPCERNRIPLAAHTRITSVSRVRKNQLVVKRIDLAAMQGNAFGAQVLAICCNYEIVIRGLEYSD